MLIEANIKLLLINFKGTELSLNDFSSLKNLDINSMTNLLIKAIPFLLKIDINNFSLYDSLNKLPGIGKFVHMGNVVTGAQKTLIINSSQKTSASGNNPNNPLLDDNATAEGSALTQEQTGSQLQLEITFEPKSKLPLILDGYLTAAAAEVKNYMFSYISNELVVFNLVLGSFATNATLENIVTSINFIEKPKNKPKKTNGIVVPNSGEVKP